MDTTPVAPPFGVPPATTVGAMVERAAVLLGLAQRATLIPAGERAVPPTSSARAVVPVRGPDRRLQAHLVYDGASDEQLERLQALADLAGAALSSLAHAEELAAREAALRRVAEQLQDALLPPLPMLERTVIAVRYRAAAREARVGGDFYDVFPLPDQSVLVVVGDVVGKGVAAAARTSRITQTLRALAMQEMPLADLLTRVDEQVSFQDPDLLATLWCGRYWPATGELLFASRGHPPALLLRADGQSLQLESESLPLGMGDLDPSPPDVRSRSLNSRDVLVLYTDGVIEASGNVIAGLGALHSACERHRDESLQVAVDTVLKDLLAQGGHTDDALILMLRRR